MKWILPVLLALFFAPGVASAAERSFTVTDFDRVQIDGPFAVTLSTGKASGAVATGSAAAIGRVAIDVQGRTLRIRPNRSAWGGYPGAAVGAATIALSTHDLRGASLSGSGSLVIDKAKAMRFEIGVAGSGRLTLGRIEADMLILGLVGSGKIVIGGKAKILRATVQGSGDIDGGALAVDDVDVQADTAGTIEIAATRTAKVTASGPGATRILGKPACTVKMIGSGEVTCGP